MWHAEGGGGGERADRIQFLSVILRPGEMFGLWLKALLSHIFIHF